MAVAAPGRMLAKLREVLALFSADRPELSGPEIAAALGRPRSTVYRLLAGFGDTGFLDHDPQTGRYRLGIQLASLGDLARRSTSLQRAARPALARLSEATGELASVMVRSGKEGVTIDVIESPHPVMIPGLLGGRQPLHATAGGKALLAWLPEEAITRLLAGPLQRYTGSTLVSVAALRREFRLARQRGYTTVHGERFEDVAGVAAPVVGHRGDVVAALSAGCPRSRGTAAHLGMMAREVMAGAAAVSAALGAPGSGRPIEGPETVRKRPRRTGSR